jgi:pimeloyl-ACP methyl ester carboxylesterase
MKRFGALALVPLLAVAIRAQEAATLSFDAVASSDGDVIEVDLSPIPKDTKVFRAVLRPAREERQAFGQRNKPVKVVDAEGGRALPLLPPRFRSFDATTPVREAVASGRGRVAFRVEALTGWRRKGSRVEVTCSVKARGEIFRVKDLRVRHRAGQTLITWKQPDPGIGEAGITFKEWKARCAAPESGPEVRYRVYRSDEPISAATIGKARLIDEVGPLTCWNGDYYGVSPKPDKVVPRYVVTDGGEPVPPGTGIYMHCPGVAGKVYYAVSAAVGGEEDLSAFDAGNATREAVEEMVGPGEPILQREERPGSFQYVKGATLRYYVRWEAPPRCNLPSRPYDYVVAFPPERKEPAPVGLHLHCWGGSLNGGYGWWYNAGQGAMLIATNQIPYDWWTGYHEHAGTWRSWSEGVVRDYTQTRVMAFLEWAAGQWKLDMSRVFTAGSSMGGSGSPNLALRRADRIAWVVSWVGVHTPARSPQFKGSYERVYGKLEWGLKYGDGKIPAFEYFDDAAYVRRDPARETPLICFSNGKNDGGIGWPQARDFWKALQETRRPHLFVWGQDGHGQRARLPGPEPAGRELGVDVRVDRTLPAFTKCSLDDDPGGGDPKDGDPEGQSNLHLTWETGEGTVTDQPEAWGMILRLGRKAPRDECTVDVTPRRCRAFRPRPGTRMRWSATVDGKEIQKGEAAADAWGLVTAQGVKVGKRGTSLRIEVAR